VLDIIGAKAKISVARGCGFGCLAILCMMVGMSIDLPAAFEAGGIAMLMMSIILILKRRYLETISHKRTELWIMLAPAERPDEKNAKAVISAILGRTYLEFALHAAKGAVFFFLISLLLAFLRSR